MRMLEGMRTLPAADAFTERRIVGEMTAAIVLESTTPAPAVAAQRPSPLGPGRRARVRRCPRHRYRGSCCDRLVAAADPARGIERAQAPRHQRSASRITSRTLCRVARRRARRSSVQRRRAGECDWSRSSPRRSARQGGRRHASGSDEGRPERAGGSDRAARQREPRSVSRPARRRRRTRTRARATTAVSTPATRRATTTATTTVSRTATRTARRTAPTTARASTRRQTSTATPTTVKAPAGAG